MSTISSLIVLEHDIYQVHICSTLFPLQAPQLKPPDSIDLAHNPSLSAALPQLTSAPDANRKLSSTDFHNIITRGAPALTGCDTWQMTLCTLWEDNSCELDREICSFLVSLSCSYLKRTCVPASSIRDIQTRSLKMAAPWWLFNMWPASILTSGSSKHSLPFSHLLYLNIFLFHFQTSLFISCHLSLCLSLCMDSLASSYSTRLFSEKDCHRIDSWTNTDSASRLLWASFVSSD